MRHGFMVVGDAMGGKTSAIMSLKAALTDLANASLMDATKVIANSSNCCVKNKSTVSKTNVSTH